MTGKIDGIAEFVITKETISQPSIDIWLDSNGVVELLKVSSRTLQRLRTENQINYSMLRGKCHYRLSDIEKVLNDRVVSTSPQTLEDFRKNYLMKSKRKNWRYVFNYTTFSLGDSTNQHLLGQPREVITYPFSYTFPV